MIIPEVMLLKIDQMANKPIPITAKTEEKSMLGFLVLHQIYKKQIVKILE